MTADAMLSHGKGNLSLLDGSVQLCSPPGSVQGVLPIMAILLCPLDHALSRERCCTRVRSSAGLGLVQAPPDTQRVSLSPGSQVKPRAAPQ